MFDDCLFCKIINGYVPADIVAKTKSAIAFRDINPQANTHVLIVPKIHIASTRELSKHNIKYLSTKRDKMGHDLDHLSIH